MKPVERMSVYLRLMRLHRPLPILLALFPVLWGLWLATQGVPSLKYLLIFIIGTCLMRSAGCVINDIFDRRIDREVARTRLRPLAAGSISMRHALTLTVILLLMAASLLLFLNVLTFFLAMAALLWTLIYPLCKRFFVLPQLVLGIAFNFGLLMAFAAIQNTLPLEAFLWFGFSILWTLIYDTEYALCDREDDARIGIHSSARLFGRHWQKALLFLQVLLSVAFIVLIWPLYSEKIVPLIFTLFLLLLFFHEHRLLHQRQFFRAFSHHNSIGLLVFLSIVTAFLLK